MSLSDRAAGEYSRRFFLGGSVLLLSACGFEPVYGTKGQASALRGAIQFASPKNLREFELNQQLELRFGRAANPRYGLAVTLNLREEGLAISGSNDITRFNIIGEAQFVLRDLGSGTAVIKDEVNTFTAYSASAQPVATLAAQRDANRRLMIALADKITSQLLLQSSAL